VSTKQSPVLKYWLTTGCVAFVATCGCTLPFTQNLAQSALFGLAAIPGVAVSSIVRSCQRQQQVNHQLERGKLRLNELQHRREILDKQLRLRDKDRQEIEIRVAQLHSLAANFKDRINTDRQQYQQLEQQLASLTHYCQEQQTFATKLDRKIQEKQALRLEVDTNFNSLKVELSQLQAAKLQAISAIDRAKISLRNIQSEIERCAVTKQELALEIQQLQERQETDSGSFDRSLDRQHQLIHELDSAISSRRLIQQNLTVEVDRLTQLVAERSTELADREWELATAQQQLSETELVAKVKQAQLYELAAEILVRNNEIESSPDYLAEKLQQRELKISQLELSSKQAELDNLDLKLQAKRQEIDEIDLEKILQIFEPQPPTFSRDIDTIVVAGAWHDKFIDNPHLTVLQHIEKHGTITEAEASSKLGNARSVRQFANKLEEYAQDLPFSIRVESSPKGNRYLKETQN
jgi:DNA repair exonuclease SbcCD ATPase subunit